MKGLQPITNHHPQWLPTVDTFRTLAPQNGPCSNLKNSLRQKPYRLEQGIPDSRAIRPADPGIE